MRRTVYVYVAQQTGWGVKGKRGEQGREGLNYLTFDITGIIESLFFPLFTFRFPHGEAQSSSLDSDQMDALQQITSLELKRLFIRKSDS